LERGAAAEAMRHLVGVTDCFQAASLVRAFLAMFWPGLCLMILLRLARLVSPYLAWLRTRPFYCKVFLQS